MAGPDGVGSGNAVPPVAPGSGSAVAPVGTTEADKRTAAPTPGIAASKSGTLPPAAPDQAKAGSFDFSGINAALEKVHEAVAARETAYNRFTDVIEVIEKGTEAKPEVAEQFKDALAKGVPLDGIKKHRQETLDDANRDVEAALANLNFEIEKVIVAESPNRPFIHPRTPEEWIRARRIADAYSGQPGGRYVGSLANQLDDVVGDVKALSADLAKGSRWDPSSFEESRTLQIAKDIVTRPRPGESAEQRWQNQLRRLACFLDDLSKNNVDRRIFAAVAIHCAEAMGISSISRNDDDLKSVERILDRYHNPEINAWINQTRWRGQTTP